MASMAFYSLNPTESMASIAQPKSAVASTKAADSSTIVTLYVEEGTVTKVSSSSEVQVVNAYFTNSVDATAANLGTVHGTIATTGLDQNILTLNLDFYFTAASGVYDKSTLVINGRYFVINGKNELALVGGTKYFKNVVGYAATETITVGSKKFVKFTFYVKFVGN
ncbi:hypothetical protein M569_00749 [Genlisea aurea]|uniref:Dirigent protein n=1 Tax=Genlisea aurea TaxID=192259 RepID=S8EMU1_9LAMI|nr:hypothetical protein M569_00749 [Genlisea aurea]